MGTAYYNEWDANAAAWIRQLIADKQIPDGYVDERSITEIQPSDLRGFTQVHFFAGIAGWPLALKLAGWPENRPVWTASLPCQSFSSAGKQRGTADERHLWPVFERLVRECRPPVCIGEQVASKLARTDWLPGVCLDLQNLGYSATAVDICAPCAGEVGEGRIVRGDQETWERIILGAPHIRQRLYWVACRMADTPGDRQQRGRQTAEAQEGREPGRDVGGELPGGSEGRTVCDSRVADTEGERSQGIMGGTERPGSGRQEPISGTQGHGATGRLEHTLRPEAERLGRIGIPVEPEQEAGRPGYADAWAHTDLIGCADGKARRFEPGIFPLAHGLPRGVVPSGDPGIAEYANATGEARVMRLKGYGNAIAAPLAAMFISTCMEVLPE